MRILVLALILALAASFAFTAPVLIVSASPTLSWNAVTKDVNGATLPTGGALSYTVVSRPSGGGTVTTVVSGITALTTKVTLTPWQVYDLGVQAVFVYQGLTYTSAVDWGSVETNPFTVSSGAAPASVSGLSASP